MDEQRYLAKLVEKRVALADGMTQHPVDQTEFAFGHMCGVNHGLRLAEQLMLDMLKEKEDE